VAADEDLDLSREAVIALSRVAPKDPQVAADLVKLLDSDRALDRRQVLRVVKGSGQIALTTDWLAREMVSDRHGLRREAARLLGDCGVEGTARIAEMLSDPRSEYRIDAIYELDRCDKVGPGPFLPVLKDPAPSARRAAIHALTRRKAKEAAPRIADLVADEDQLVRFRAARALEELGAPVPSAAPALLRLIAEGDRQGVSLGLAALRAAGSTPLAHFLDCHDEAPPDAEKPSMTMRLKPRGGTDEEVALLDRLLLMVEDNVHGPALVAALKETLAKDQDAALVSKLASDDDTVRRVSAALLGHLARDGPAAIRALETMTGDPNPDVRAAALAAVGRLRR
jgi:HEAT repeat protein